VVVERREERRSMSATTRLASIALVGERKEPKTNGVRTIT